MAHPAFAQPRVAFIAPVQEEASGGEQDEAQDNDATDAADDARPTGPNITVAYYRMGRGPLLGSSDDTLQHVDRSWGGGLDIVIGLRDNPTVGVHVAAGSMHVHAADANAPDGRFDGYRIVPAGVALGFSRKVFGVPFAYGGVLDLLQLEYLDGAATLPYKTQGTLAIGAAVRLAVQVAWAPRWLTSRGIWFVATPSVGIETQLMSVQSSGVRVYESSVPPLLGSFGLALGVKVGDPVVEP